MEWIIKIVLCGILLIIVWQDFSDQKVMWFLIPIVFISGLILGLLQFSFGEYSYYILLNLIICGILSLGVIVYSFIRQGNVISPINKTLGLGDILILFSLTSIFSPLNYIFFLISSFLLTLIIHSFIVHSFYSNRKIPLAGYLSVYLIVVFIVESCSNYWGPYYDEILIQCVGKIH